MLATHPLHPHRALQPPAPRPCSCLLRPVPVAAMSRRCPIPSSDISIPRASCSILEAALGSFSVVYYVQKYGQCCAGFLARGVGGSAQGGCRRGLASLHVQEVPATRRNKPRAVPPTLLCCSRASFRVPRGGSGLRFEPSCVPVLSPCHLPVPRGAIGARKMPPNPMGTGRKTGKGPARLLQGTMHPGRLVLRPHIATGQHSLDQGGQLRVGGDVVVAQAQLFGKGDELHLALVLVGAACRLEELGGSRVRGVHPSRVPNPLPGPPAAPPVPTLRPSCTGSTASSSACRMRSGQASTFTLRGGRHGVGVSPEPSSPH